MPPEQQDSQRIATLRPRQTRPNYNNWRLNLTTHHDFDDPKSYSEAIQRPDKDKWLEAMREELKSLKECDVWSLADKPRNKNIVTNRWVLRIKRDPNGNISRYKARLVARGFSQIYGIDYNETYAPTASMSIVRLLISNAAVMKLKLAQFDIKTAFLYGDLEEEVYMQQPEGFVIDNNKVWRLKRSLYGLKQAPRQWSKKFTSFLSSIGLKQSVEDRCVFFQRNPLVYIVLYVDDGIIFAREQPHINAILEQFKQRFNIHVMPLNCFLGFQIKRAAEDQIIIHQEAYINKLLFKFGLDSLKSERSPISPSQLPDDTSPIAADIPYRQIVGSLLYTAVNTRIDILYPVSLACRTVDSPTYRDWLAVTRILRYLSGNPDLALSYRHDRHEGLVTYCDAAYANDSSGRSTSGIIIMFGGAPISWHSNTQKVVSTSSTEAEIVSLCSAFKETIWLHNFAIEIGIIEPQPIKIFCDNTSSIKLTNDERSVQRTKHFRARFAFLQEKTRDNIVTIHHVRSENQLADMLTKPTSVKSFISTRNKLMISHRAKASLMAMAVLSIFTTTIAVNFQTVRPIIYQETDKLVDIGVTQYSIDFTYSNPCEILSSFMPKPNHGSPFPNGASPVDHHTSGNVADPSFNYEASYVNTFINECNKLYDNTWMVKVNELLTRGRPAPVPELMQQVPGHLIKKRGIGDAISGIVIYNFLSSVFELINPWSSYHKLQNLSERQKVEQEQLMKFKHDFNVTLAIQKGMLDLISNNARNIRDQKRQMSHFIHLSSDVTWMSSLIQSRIIFATADMRTIIDEFIQRRVATTELADLFNMTELYGIDPQDTEFVSVEALTPQTIRFTFNIRLTSPDTFIYHVHAFRYWDNLTHTPTLMEYQGSRFVVYNKTANCIKGLEDTTERANTIDCSIKDYVDNNVNIWRRIVTTDEIYSQDVSAFKRTPNSNYIYCFPFNITIESQFHRCPTLMFKLKIDKAFTTGNLTYTPIIRKINLSRKQHNFIEDISLGHFQDTSLAASDIIMYDRIRELTSTNEALIHNQEQSITITKHGYTWWFTISTTLTLILITIGLVAWNIFLSRKMKSHSKQVANDVAELKTYDRVSCVNCLRNSSTSTTMVQNSNEGRPKVEVGRDESIVINVNPATRALPATPSTIL